MASQDKIGNAPLMIELTQADIKNRLSTVNTKHDRFATHDLRDFCKTSCKRMLGVFGLRRTGKSVMLWTVAQELMQAGSRVVFWEFLEGVSTDNAIQLLNHLKLSPGDYLFIDEATFADNFPIWGLYLYNRFASVGVRVIVSGTYSYALRIASADALFDRIKLLPTTIISYAEYNYLTSDSLTKFMRAGGILDPVDGVWADYLDTAVVSNVVKSMTRLNSTKYLPLANIKESTARSILFYIMQEIYLQRILDDISSEYEYPELTQSLDNLRKWGKTFSDVEVHQTKLGIDQTLRWDESEVDNKKTMVLLFRDMLLEMGLLDGMDVITLTEHGVLRSREYFISQPGLMYYLALVSKESALSNITNSTSLAFNIENVVEGRILENIVFRDTRLKNSDSRVVKVRGDNFEIDMVVVSPNGVLDLYEVKKSSNADNRYAKHLLNSQLKEMLTGIFGVCDIRSKAVLYTGTDKEKENGVAFVNIEKFLTGIELYYG